ncbi:transcriptional regulator FilR1 domain-containing protein [Haladaptatus halobius]|uniref:transcriptional regulator FilR1 domain-containing protein n=1 Tax=Haladaptatus halobius TaxID=2884875 RepID=UPI003F6149C1
MFAADRPPSAHATPDIQVGSFGLTLLDERVFVGTHDENGQFSACLESTDSTLYAWAMNLYAEYRAAAQQIEDVSDLP